jgi:hypothetical protein
LTGNVGWLLPYVSVVLDPLVPPHGLGNWRIAASRGK